MRVIVRCLGLDLLDVEVFTDSPTPEPDDTHRDLSGGTTGSIPMGFVPRMEKPHEMDTPDRDW